jgi:hypothetical protein
MKYHINVAAGVAADITIADISVEELDRCLQSLQIREASGRKIVEHANRYTTFRQRTY